MNDRNVQDIEKQIYELTQELHAVRKKAPRTKVRNYEFATRYGTVSLLDLFGGKSTLLAIHNMGQACRYCTLWADGFNPFLPHLESALSVVLLSKDEPDTQRRFANSRGWRFPLASHGGGDYMAEQSVVEGAGNMPGAVVYERDGDTIFRKAATPFGPGDLYCSMWSLLGLAGISEADWTPQFSYWSRPATLDDGGQNVMD